LNIFYRFCQNYIYLDWFSGFQVSGSLKLKNPEKPRKTRNKFHDLLMRAAFSLAHDKTRQNPVGSIVTYWLVRWLFPVKDYF